MNRMTAVRVIYTINGKRLPPRVFDTADNAMLFVEGLNGTVWSLIEGWVGLDANGQACFMDDNARRQPLTMI